MPPELEAVVAARGVHKHFGQTHVLKGVDLSMATGDVVSVIGSSGSGKTTMLRCVNLLEDFEQGSIKIDGEAVGYTAAPERRRAAIARYFVMRMQLRAHKLDRAMISVDAFLGNFPGHALTPKVQIMQADVHLERREFDKAVLAKLH